MGFDGQQLNFRTMSLLPLSPLWELAIWHSFIWFFRNAESFLWIYISVAVKSNISRDLELRIPFIIEDYTESATNRVILRF